MIAHACIYIYSYMTFVLFIKIGVTIRAIIREPIFDLVAKTISSCGRLQENIFFVNIK